jgi:hypothetical protein
MSLPSSLKQQMLSCASSYDAEEVDDITVTALKGIGILDADLIAQLDNIKACRLATSGFNTGTILVGSLLLGGPL